MHSSSAVNAAWSAFDDGGTVSVLRTQVIDECDHALPACCCTYRESVCSRTPVAGRVSHKVKVVVVVHVWTGATSTPSSRIAA